MTVQRICALHGRYVGKACETCRRDRALRPQPRTRAVAVRSSARWKRVQAQAIERDDHRCTYGLEAGDRGTRHYPEGRCPVVQGLQGHHRVPIEDGGQPFDLGNVRTLCAQHHAREEANHRREKEIANG